MKVLLIQEAGRHKDNSNFRECLSLQRAMKYHNHDAEVWGLGHKNYHQKPDWESYDLIINLENHDEVGWVPSLRDIKTKKMIWSIDCHCKGLQSFMNIFNEGKYDLILQSTPEFINENSIWFPNCYDDELIKPLQIEKKYDVGFCGNINNRGNFINIMNSFFDFRLDQGIRGQYMVNSINSYKVHFNANISIDINYRNFETIGCGTCLLTSYNKHYDKLGFIDGVNCLIYKDENEMIEKAKMVLKDEKLRHSIEKNGIELAKNHTYKQRIKILEEIL